MPIQIKEEPMDEDYGDENDIDPSLFLDNSHIDKKDEVDGSPPSILSSLGLQASGINPLSFLVRGLFNSLVLLNFKLILLSKFIFFIIFLIKNI